MTTERIDVLAALDALSQANVGPLERKSIAAACAAVAELIEADKAYDVARANYEAIDFPGSARLAALEATQRRRAAALARVGGAS